MEESNSRFPPRHCLQQQNWLKQEERFLFFSLSRLISHWPCALTCTRSFSSFFLLPFLTTGSAAGFPQGERCTQQRLYNTPLAMTIVCLEPLLLVLYRQLIHSSLTYIVSSILMPMSTLGRFVFFPSRDIVQRY